MAAEERLQLTIVGKDRSGKRVLRETQAEVRNLDNVSKASFRGIGDVSERTFRRIQQDVRLATQDFDRGVIGTQDYARALQFARQEALTLRSAGVAPLGSELKAFDSIMKQTGGSTSAATQGLGSLRGSMGALAARATGVSGRMGETASVLLGFSTSTLIAVGILGGLAAVAGAFRLIGKEAREARESATEFIAEFDRFQEFLERFEARRQAQIERQNLLEEQALLEGPGLPVTNLTSLGRRLGRAVGAPGRAQEIEQRLQELDRAIRGYEETFGPFTEDAKKHRADLAEENRERVLTERELTEKIAQANFELGDILAALPSTGRLLLQGGVVRPSNLPGLTAGRMREGVFGGGIGPTTTDTFGAGMGIGQFGTVGQEGALTAASQSLLTPWRSAMSQVSDEWSQRMTNTNKFLADAFAKTGDNIKGGGRQLAGALSVVASSIAGLISGSQSPFGAASGILGGLSMVPGFAAASAPLAIASVGFGFLDALTSDRAKSTMTQAHLTALRTHDREKPIATILLNFGEAFDPGNRAFQRIIDNVRREAQAAGANVAIV